MHSAEMVRANTEATGIKPFHMAPFAETVSTGPVSTRFQELPPLGLVRQLPEGFMPSVDVRLPVTENTTTEISSMRTDEVRESIVLPGLLIKPIENPGLNLNYFDENVLDTAKRRGSMAVRNILHTTLPEGERIFDALIEEHGATEVEVHALALRVAEFRREVSMNEQKPPQRVQTVKQPSVMLVGPAIDKTQARPDRNDPVVHKVETARVLRHHKSGVVEAIVVRRKQPEADSI